MPVLAEGEEETIVLDIRLPNELTANKLRQYNDNKAPVRGPNMQSPEPVGRIHARG